MNNSSGESYKPSASDTNGRARAGNVGALVHVEPPRREDLQPSYAQQIHGDDDPVSHGWYGGMSEPYAVSLKFIAYFASQYPRILHWNIRLYSMLCYLSKSI